MSPSPTYRACAGDILDAQGRPLTPDTAREVRRQRLREAAAALAEALELQRALAGASRWRRAARS
jgi:hypothetical protein